MKIAETPTDEEVPALEADQVDTDAAETPQPKDYDGVYLKSAPYCYHCHKVTPGIYGNRCGDCGERKAIIPGVTT